VPIATALDGVIKVPSSNAQPEYVNDVVPQVAAVPFIILAARAKLPLLAIYLRSILSDMQDVPEFKF
jgi:hypothetical protein